MLRCLRLGPALLIGCLLVSWSVAPAASGVEVSADEAVSNQIDRYVQEFVDQNNVPGVGVAVVQGDRTLLVKGYGRADGSEPVTPHTQFLLGSVSKSFTATAVLQLVAAGAIDLDESIRTYLPQFPVKDRGHAITVRSLLEQTSGLADAGFPAYTLPQPRTLAGRLSSLKDAQLVSSPGTEFHYTDVNYGVLARLVEVVSGVPFSTYIHDHVLEPLAMTDSLSVLRTDQLPSEAAALAQGHVQVFGVPVRHDELNGFVGGSGGIVSTAADMDKYLLAQLGDSPSRQPPVITPSALDTMHTRSATPESTYAVGWFVGRSLDGSDLLEHNGVLSAYHADIALIPDDGAGVALLYNYNHALADYEGLKDGILALLQGHQPANGRLGAQLLGLMLGLVALATVTWQVIGLVRTRRWVRRNAHRRWWQLAPGLLWKIVPVSILAALPQVVSLLSDRVFSREQLFWSMPDIHLWLILSAVLGVSIATTHVVMLQRHRHPLRRN